MMKKDRLVDKLGIWDIREYINDPTKYRTERMKVIDAHLVKIVKLDEKTEAYLKLFLRERKKLMKEWMELRKKPFKYFDEGKYK